MLLKLMLIEEGKKEELARGKLIDIVNYLKENKNIYNWVLDEDATIELPKLEEIETVRELKAELEKVDMSWWSLEIEKIKELHYFKTKEGVSEFLKKYDFNYTIPDKGEKSKYYVLVDTENNEVEYCSVVYIESGIELSSHPFYDRKRKKDFIKEGYYEELAAKIEKLAKKVAEEDKKNNVVIDTSNDERMKKLYDKFMNSKKFLKKEKTYENGMYFLDKYFEYVKRELSLDNGIHFVDLENLTAAEKEKIQDCWEAITNFMDAEDMEAANDITSVDTTDTLNDKIQYLKDYLSIAKDNLILG